MKKGYGIDETRDLRAAPVATEGGALPDATSDKLERTGMDLSRTSNASNAASTPALVARLREESPSESQAAKKQGLVDLKGGAHELGITNGLDRIVQA